MSALPAITRRVGWHSGADPEAALSREWLVTNGLGGYASGTASGVLTRRYHGVLVAALPAPLGRVLTVAALWDDVDVGDGAPHRLTGREPFGGDRELPEGSWCELVLEDGLPVWRFEWDHGALEKRLFMPHLRNATCVSWTLVRGDRPVTLNVRPVFDIRSHGDDVHVLHDAAAGHGAPPDRFPYRVVRSSPGVAVEAASGQVSTKLLWHAPQPVALDDAPETVELLYRVERDRGYDFRGPVASPGRYTVSLEPSATATLVVSTDAWDDVADIAPGAALDVERGRRRGLIARSAPAARSGLAAELVLAADQFVISPHTRTAEERAAPSTAAQPARSVIAGYHWFTDWGRDTMISLEGLALMTGRTDEAAGILRTFAGHVRDGLIPNLFPEGETHGVYHTADATLWFFHALSRYEAHSGDRELGRALRPTLRTIIDHHLAGTRFGIHVDPDDGLLHQGAEGYQLTWMDAKVDGWVVTPRRGKAVEINALFYNALRLLEGWLAADGDADGATSMKLLADRVYGSFNRRFWHADGGYLYDVVDCDGRRGEVDSSFRPNQLLAISLPHPVLDPFRWQAVVTAVRDRLVTPFGLRSLAPGSPDYRASYRGDLRARDAAYHQGTVWGWLIGPYLDACRRADPGDASTMARFLDAIAEHLGEAGLGTISEIFDAESPFTPRGCIAQAWSVAEALRCLVDADRSGKRSH